MSPREPADHRLERVLHILPEAAREGGASIDDLAATLDVSPKRILRDLQEVTERDLYREPPLDIRISIESRRISVWTTGELRRPVKLAPKEALALALGLRLLADGADEGRAARLRALAGRMDAALAAFPASEAGRAFGIDAGEPAASDALDRLREAAREGRRCALRYLKPGADAAEDRTLDPYAIVHAGGRWYAIGHCPEAEKAGTFTTVRAFRLDRILELAPTGATFEPPEDFDVAPYVDGEGSVFRADETVEAAVRYSADIARWIEEAAEIDERDGDGGVVVRHEVADPEWLVRHVLYHGAAAEVVEPEWLRELVAARAAACAATAGNG